ncbi:hypothetical protein GOB94_01010 [Granulicella sp. 5B5]|uniref:hypothetical protein n=1 Tax=Granulicella sp. 5B5 TaxID=1617967 RepID=UPI0015F75A61|nr:hypothetical protein [Granulicella sp. 5B5]QMV17447.1 hypothetical protein GOB94_01010 [Granulicella sp. 5B5]
MSPRKLMCRLMYGVWVVVVVGLVPDGVARAAGPGVALDAVTLTHMEEQAAQANPRDRCYRYAEVLAALTELEGQQIAAGQEAQARVTMQQMNDIAAKVQAEAVGNAKRLKDTEMMLERTTRRVSDMVHVVGYAQESAMQATLQHLNAVHTKVLAMVFAH